MRKTQLLLALTTIGFAGSVLATNGMNLEGYGPIATGMGGASMAYDNGTAAVMNNPATLGLMKEGSRFDLAIGGLHPDVTVNCPAAACGAATSLGSGGDAYYMPAVGWVKKSSGLTYGVAMFAQGGMGTEYAAGTFMGAGSPYATRSEVGVGRLIAPLVYDVNPNLTVGGSLDLVWAGMDMQMAMSGAQFGAEVGRGAIIPSGSLMAGFAAFGPAGDYAYFDFSNNNDYTGKTKATGFAGKLGLTYKVSPSMTLGATYHSKTHLGDLEGSGVIKAVIGGAAEVTMPGKFKIRDFEWPETFGFGLAYQANDRLMIAADYKRINWADVMKDFKMSFIMANGADLNMTMVQNWDDQNVFELGMSYKVTDAFTARAGINIANNPVDGAFLNPLFPAIVKSHYTLGFGYAFDKDSTLDFSLSYAPESSQTISAGASTGFSVDHAQTNNWQLMYSKRF